MYDVGMVAYLCVCLYVIACVRLSMSACVTLIKALNTAIYHNKAMAFYANTHIV